VAELIPLEYRIRVARGRLVSRWITVLIVMFAVAGAALLSTQMWKRKQTAECARLELQYRDSAVLIKQYNDLRAKREDLLQRMERMEGLRNDKVLLSLLNSVSSCFSEYDCLEYVCIDAHPTDRKTGDPKNAAPRYSVRLRGITVDDTSHSHLLERLTAVGKKSDIPVAVPLGEKRLSPMLDGSVTSFDITCDQPLAKGG
jgi:hypothetical protein